VTQLSVTEHLTGQKAMRTGKEVTTQLTKPRMPSHITDPVELVYLSLMLRWERTAPPDRSGGLLDGKPARNTQTARLAYVLQKVAVGLREEPFATLARYSRRKDGESSVSRNPATMIQPHALTDGWYVEGCMNLQQKQMFLQNITRLGLSSAFAACLDDFVAGKSVEDYLPTEEEQVEILRKIDEIEGRP